MDKTRYHIIIMCLIIADIGFFIMIDRTNGYYEKLLLVRYGGKDSIMSMLSLYLYQSLITSKDYPVLSLIFEGMAYSKLRHIKMLEGIIFDFSDTRKIQFNIIKKQTVLIEDDASTLNIGSILKYDIDWEENSIKENERLVEIIKEPTVTAVLRDIIKDEKKHLQRIRRIMSELNCSNG